MTSWPFFLAATWMIFKYSKMPGLSFLSVLSFNYLTYSFSMIRGMLAMTFLICALICAFKDHWFRFILCVLVATSFHITSLAFCIIPILKYVRWSYKKIGFICLLIIIMFPFLPDIWETFVTQIIAKIVPNYNYYGYKGGEFADALFFIYLIVFIFGLVYVNIQIKTYPKKLKLNSKVYTPQIAKQNTDILSYRNENLLIGMSMTSLILIVLTAILSEMIRIAMLFSLGNIIICGLKPMDKQIRFTSVLQILEIVVFIFYFLFASLPNMNAIPYKFF